MFKRSVAVAVAHSSNLRSMEGSVGRKTIKLNGRNEIKRRGFCGCTPLYAPDTSNKSSGRSLSVWHALPEVPTSTLLKTASEFRLDQASKTHERWLSTKGILRPNHRSLVNCGCPSICQCVTFQQTCFSLTVFNIVNFWAYWYICTGLSSWIDINDSWWDLLFQYLP